MNRALLRLPFLRAAARLPFLLRLPLFFLFWFTLMGGMSYLGGHSGPPYNGARTFGEAVKIGVAFGTIGALAYTAKTAIFWLRDILFPP